MVCHDGWEMIIDKSTHLKEEAISETSETCIHGPYNRNKNKYGYLSKSFAVINVF